MGIPSLSFRGFSVYEKIQSYFPPGTDLCLEGSFFRVPLG